MNNLIHENEKTRNLYGEEKTKEVEERQPHQSVFTRFINAIDQMLSGNGHDGPFAMGY